MGKVADKIATRIQVLQQRRTDLQAAFQAQKDALTNEIQALRGINTSSMSEGDLDQLKVSGIISDRENDG